MHGWKLAGNVAGFAGFSLLVVVLAASSGVLPDSSPFDLLIFSVGFGIVTLVTNARKDGARGATRSVGAIVVWAVGLWIVIHADDWLGPALIGVSTLRNEAIAWFATGVALMAIAAMLTDDDRDRGRWAAASVVGLGLTALGVAIVLGGGPLTFIGFVIGFIGVSVIAITAAYSNWVADWNTRKRST